MVMQARAGNVLCLSALLTSDRIDVWCATRLGRRKTNVETKTQHVSTNNGRHVERHDASALLVEEQLGITHNPRRHDEQIAAGFIRPSKHLYVQQHNS